MSNKKENQKRYYDKHKDDLEFKQRAKESRDKERANRTPERKEEIREYNRKWKQKWYAENKDKEEFKMMKNSYQIDYRNNKTEEQKEKEKARAKALREETWYENQTRHIVYNARKRAKDSGIEFNLTKDDITIPELCPILKIPLFMGKGKRCENSPSIDRIDNSKGYTKGNVRIISARANAFKNNLTIEEVERILLYMKKEL